ncbi:MAG: YbjN domain-containing protein [Methylocystaceae bacterium]
MGQIFDIMIEYFEGSGWSFNTLGDNTIRVDFSGDNGSYICYARELSPREGCLFYCNCPVKAPEALRIEAAKFLTLANYGLIVGNFEMDWSDGEIRFKTSLYSNGQEFSSELMEPLVWNNLVIMDKYFPGLMALLYGNLNAEAAVSMVEAETQGDPS